MTIKKCVHPGCDKEAPQRRYCSMHSARLLRGQDMDAPHRNAPKSDEWYIERFKSYLSEPDEFGSIFWTGAKNKAGYGIFMFRGKAWTAHKFYHVYIKPPELGGGPVPDGMYVTHICRDFGAKRDWKHCVNQTKIGSASENRGRDREKSLGIKNGRAIVPDGVLKWAVRFCLEGRLTQKEIANELTHMGYPVSNYTISDWALRKSRTNHPKWDYLFRT